MSFRAPVLQTVFCFGGGGKKKKKKKAILQPHTAWKVAREIRSDALSIGAVIHLLAESSSMDPGPPAVAMANSGQVLFLALVFVL